ncbi:MULTISPECIES: response regulator [unclassified Caballeronia]|jgi:DNA-binding response OmpR family regulator|uniref:response regulator n=1 Tax=unclassified Caballeronia TaxID=2646786 RepID=UPI00285FED69|nr:MULTISPECIES: response regulator [unclassified Caballeronia]MDR5753126.1 response regulator [Caballeronia sp. LZ024]MDR5842009.1 response regulator [Caballeronia sp. LZ031]
MRILFIEDDPRLADAFAALAASIGHEPEVAYDGQSALALTAANTYDAIFLDIGLPDADGRTLCQQLRAATPSAQACVVAVTGRANLSAQELDAFDGYLLKPISQEALEDAIKGC